MNFTSVKVSKILLETNEAKTFFFDIPEKEMERFRHLPGQYLTIQLFINGDKYRRSYSIPSDIDEKKLAITVKKIEKGVVSSYMNDHIKVGEYIELSVPQGRFLLEEELNLTKKYLLVGAGSGITPLMSMLKYLLHEPDNKIVLVLGNKNTSSVIYRESLEELSNKHSEQFRLVNVFSRSEKDEKIEHIKGRIDVNIIEELLGDELYMYQCYICGPEALIEAMKTRWIERGIGNKIFYEKFTNLKPTVQKNDKKSRKTDLSVELDDEWFHFELEEGKTILDKLLEKNIDAPYSCSIGNCSSCIAKVMEGKVEMYNCETLDEDEIDEGYILTCQAHSLTDNLVISFEY